MNQLQLNHIINGQSLQVLKSFPDQSVDCVITSPPYWALRDYGSDGQIGLQVKYQEYINNLCNIFDQVYRVLKKTGTCFVNIGDTYGKSISSKSTKKSLLQIPSRFAIQMCNRGWILRNQIIWHKPNQMPSSVKDRYTVDFEKLFFFTKSPKYFFKQQLQAYTKPLGRWGGDVMTPNIESTWDQGTGQKSYRKREVRPNPDGKNKRCVWSINTKPFKQAHFATYPEQLIWSPIDAGCPQGGVVLDPFMGAGTTAIVALKQNKHYIGIDINQEYIKIAQNRIRSSCG